METNVMNNAFLDDVTSKDPELVKRASDTVNEFTRVKMREDGFARKILPPIPISNDQLDRQVFTDKPSKIVDMEFDVPAAISIPFATNPQARYIRGKRYTIVFNRIVTRRFNKDINELRTYHMDIRQVISDNAIKDMLAEEDAKFIFTCNAAMGGTAGTAAPATGTVQWATTPDEITRESVVESLKLMNRTPSRLECSSMLINQISIKDVLKWFRDEVGGDMAQDVLINGWTQEKILGRKITVTIKDDLVPEDSIFHFAEPTFLGKFYMLDDITMYTKTEHFMIEFFAYETLGGAIGNVAGVTRQDFNVVGGGG